MFKALLVLVVGLAAAGVYQGAAPSPAKKQLIAHRGASAYAPEHTLQAYALAIEQGADFVEQDLAVTKDGVLVCIHDLTLERTTNVEEVFPHRFSRDTKKSAAPVASPPSAAAGTQTGGPEAAGRRWLVHDFTLAEIKRLDAGSSFDKKFAGATIPTFQEAIDAVHGKAGLYPELKDPEFYRQQGVRPDVLLAGMLRKNGLVANPKTPVIIQSFDDTTLQQLARDLPQVPRVFLVDPARAARLDSPEKLRGIAAWASGIAPHKAIVEAHPEIVKQSHDAGLTVTLWTFRSAMTTFPSVRDEMAKFLYDLGVDALFTDNPDQFPRR
jgi:glycerophosphoryl diester phosphodiesterase